MGSDKWSVFFPGGAIERVDANCSDEAKRKGLDQLLGRGDPQLFWPRNHRQYLLNRATARKIQPQVNQ